MTYVIDFTDEDGKRRTERMKLSVQDFNRQFLKTLVAYKLHGLGFNVQVIHSITPEVKP